MTLKFCSESFLSCEYKMINTINDMIIIVLMGVCHFF